MKKWKIGCIGVVLVCLGLLIWGIFSLGVYAPATRILHIQTPGGPVPVRVVVYDSRGGRIEVGYSGLPNNDASLVSGRSGEFWVTDFAYSPLRIELEFPRSSATLKVEEVIDDEGKKRLKGYWMQTEKHAAIKKIQVSQLHSMRRENWFDEATEVLEDESDTDQPKGKIDGRWFVEFEGSGEKALLEIYYWIPVNGPAPSTIDAEFLSYRTPNRFFAGRVDGDLVRLASFDNGLPVLIHAELQLNGTLEGDLWIGDWEHQTWTATRE